jgi:hypothetical protein
VLRAAAQTGKLRAITGTSAAWAMWCARCSVWLPKSRTLDVGPRRIKVPRHGHIIVAGKAPLSPVSPIRPPIVAISSYGKRMTELGPDDHLDSLTWAALQER